MTCCLSPIHENIHFIIIIQLHTILIADKCMFARKRERHRRQGERARVREKGEREGQRDEEREIGGRQTETELSFPLTY